MSYLPFLNTLLACLEFEPFRTSIRAHRSSRKLVIAISGATCGSDGWHRYRIGETDERKAWKTQFKFSAGGNVIKTIENKSQRIWIYASSMYCLPNRVYRRSIDIEFYASLPVYRGEELVSGSRYCTAFTGNNALGRGVTCHGPLDLSLHGLRVHMMGTWPVRDQSHVHACASRMKKRKNNSLLRYGRK